MMTDPIADMLTRVRNAAIAKLDRTEVPHSKLKVAIAKILKDEGYIGNFEENDRTISVTLRYAAGRKSAVVGIRRASRPGLRWYVKADQVPTVHNGLGIAILSTSHGVMTDRAAREAGVGGEVLCEVW